MPCWPEPPAGVPFLLPSRAIFHPIIFGHCERKKESSRIQSPRTIAWRRVGVTEAFAAVARTGSVCVDIGADIAGYVSLLPRLHIVLVDIDKLVFRPSDLFRLEQFARPAYHRSFVFISGPSATADMGPLVRGVHGPHELHIMVLC